MPDELDNLDGLDALDNLDALDGLDALDFDDTPRALAPSIPTEVPAGEIEQATADELSELLGGFKARAKAEQKRFELATDSEYWFAVCFQTREQKDAFLEAVDWYQHGDKYLDGAFVAKQLNIKLPSADVPYNTGRVDRRLEQLTNEEGKV
jgi:hypothetical protein